MLTVNVDIQDPLINGQQEMLSILNLFKVVFIKYM